MSVQCKYCSAEIPDGVVVCPSCGKAIRVQPSHISNTVPISTLSTHKPKRKWWHILITVIIVLMLAAAFLPMACRYLIPEMTLAAALSQVGSEMSDRLEGSPLSLIEHISQWQDQRTFHWNFGLSLGLLGDIRAGSTTSTDYQNQTSFNQSVTSMMSFNSDTEGYYLPDRYIYGADGHYIGIDYATLEEDLKSSPAFANAGQDEIDKFLTTVNLIQRHNQANFQEEDPSDVYSQLFADAAQDLKLTPGFEKYHVNGKNRLCGTLSVVLDQNYIANLLEAAADFIENERGNSSDGELHQLLPAIIGGEDVKTLGDTIQSLRDSALQIRVNTRFEASCTFYLLRSRLVGIGMDLFAGSENSADGMQLDLCLGKDVAAGDITLTAKNTDGGVVETVVYTLCVDRTDTEYIDTVRFQSTDADGLIYRTMLSSTWNRTSGSLQITSQDGAGDSQFRLNASLLAQDDMVTLDLPNLHLLFKKNEEEEGDSLADLFQITDFTVKLVFRKGAEITVPNYVPLSQWTVEDLELFGS